jgi:predicted ribosome-associated RNA-binding protein Tma20
MKLSQLKQIIKEEIGNSLNEAKPSEDGAQYVGKTIEQINQDEESIEIIFTDGETMYINASTGRHGNVILDIM